MFGTIFDICLHDDTYSIRFIWAPVITLALWGWGMCPGVVKLLDFMKTCDFRIFCHLVILYVFANRLFISRGLKKHPFEIPFQGCLLIILLKIKFYWNQCNYSEPEMLPSLLNYIGKYHFMIFLSFNVFWLSVSVQIWQPPDYTSESNHIFSAFPVRRKAHTLSLLDQQRNRQRPCCWASLSNGHRRRRWLPGNLNGNQYNSNSV